MKLLANEYILALKSKHWLEGNDDQISANMRYLISIINDCHRLSTTHIDVLSTIECDENFQREEFIMMAKQSFTKVINK